LILETPAPLHGCGQPSNVPGNYSAWRRRPVLATAYAGLRRGGRLVLVALPASGTLHIPVFDTVLNGTSVIGSIVGTRADLDEVFALHAAGLTRVIYETRPLAAVNDAIAEMVHGKAKARLVLEP
jgi:propanol-preferring alcohol dehydrogenase